LNKRVLVCVFLLLSLPVAAVDDESARYEGGTTVGLTPGIIGRFDTTSPAALIFQSSAGRITIPYAAISSFQYSRDVKHHLGVLPAIAIGLIKHRQHQHFFRISYRDEQNQPQVVIFEVAKHMPRALEAVLKAKAPQACKPDPRCASGNKGELSQNETACPDSCFLRN